MSTGKFIAKALNEKENIARVAGIAGEADARAHHRPRAGHHARQPDRRRRADGHVDVIVPFDVEYLRSLLKRAVPTASVEPIPAGKQLDHPDRHGGPHRGHPGDPGHDQQRRGRRQPRRQRLRVGGVQQVQLCVVVARVSRNELRSMAFTFFDEGQRHFFGSTIGGPGSATSAAATSVNGSSSTIKQSADLVLGFVNNKQSFFGFLNALRNEGLAKVLSEPRLVTLSGRTASFLDGGEQAIPVPAGLGQIGNPVRGVRHPPELPADRARQRQDPPGGRARDQQPGRRRRHLDQRHHRPGRATQRVHTTSRWRTARRCSSAA